MAVPHHGPGRDEAITRPHAVSILGHRCTNSGSIFTLRFMVHSVRSGSWFIPCAPAYGLFRALRLIVHSVSSGLWFIPYVPAYGFICTPAHGPFYPDPFCSGFYCILSGSWAIFYDPYPMSNTLYGFCVIDHSLPDILYSAPVVWPIQYTGNHSVCSVV